MPLLTADAAAEISAPMLTCISVSDGYQFELLLRVGREEPAITRVRIGPYFFKKEYTPTKILGGLLTVGGPENAMLMHKSVPPRWSRLGWEVKSVDQTEATYIAWHGSLGPGQVGVFRFVSLLPPGGLRVGLEIDAGRTTENYGVSGPNYEHYEVKQHDH